MGPIYHWEQKDPWNTNPVPASPTLGSLPAEENSSWCLSLSIEKFMLSLRTYHLIHPYVASNLAFHGSPFHVSHKSLHESVLLHRTSCFAASTEFCDPRNMQWKTHRADKMLPVQAGLDWQAKWWATPQATGRGQDDNWKWTAKGNCCNCPIYSFSPSSPASAARCLVHSAGDVSQWSRYLGLLPCGELNFTSPVVLLALTFFWMAPLPHYLGLITPRNHFGFVFYGLFSTVLGK